MRSRRYQKDRLAAFQSSGFTVHGKCTFHRVILHFPARQPFHVIIHIIEVVLRLHLNQHRYNQPGYSWTNLKLPIRHNSSSHTSVHTFLFTRSCTESLLPNELPKTGSIIICIVSQQLSLVIPGFELRRPDDQQSSGYPSNNKSTADLPIDFRSSVPWQ